MNPSDATREILWNVPVPWLMYVLLVPTVLIGGWGLYRRVRIWRRGQPAMRFDRPTERLGLVLRHAVAQGRTLRVAYAGFFHFLLYTGFLVLTAATTVVMLDHDFGTSIMRGGFYLWFQSLVVDLFGALFLLGLALAAFRRWISKPSHLVYTDEASLILVALFVIGASGFLVEGLRIAATDDPWGPWSPVGYLVARACGSLASDAALTTAHAWVWWTHLIVTFAFFAWAPYTKLIHVVTAPLNIYFANLGGYAQALSPVNFGDDDTNGDTDGDDEEVPFGVGDLTQLTWKDLLDLDACTECGRCTEVCPAASAGKPLSPRDVILDLRALARDNTDLLLADPRRPIKDGEPMITTIREAPTFPADNALAPESLWSCTTCAACLEACPVHIEQMPKIIGARRYQVMEQAEMPDTIAAAVQSLEKRGHPYPGTRFSRVDWAEGLDIRVMSELEDPSEVDVLLWVGCASAFMERNHSTIRSLAQLMTRAGVSFGILGRDERCTGDPARRIGNEFLFESMAQKNIGVLRRFSVKKIVTSCPHCMNSFANDYPVLGGEFEVLHHSAFLAELLESGKLRPEGTVAGSVTFHDPCYLGRYNGIFDEPRELVQIATGKTSGEMQAFEMKASREKSFCCGGGGGMAFVDEDADQRVNRWRAEQALETGADVVGVACPFCMTMLEDGVNACRGDRPTEVKDIAELLWDATEPVTPEDHQDRISKGSHGSDFKPL